jgi:signal transduction histidine kinase
MEVEVNAKPLMYRGEPHVLYAARDISERREAEARSAELQLQLRQAQKMEAVGQLTGGIAHDFNNILTSVIGYVVLGLERAEALSDATLQRQLDQAHRAAQRARELIMQMLAFARRQRGERRSIALAPLVQQSLQLLRATLPSSAVLDFVVVDHTPTVLADPVQLEQVLFNLCINARDAIQGAGYIRVRLGRHQGPWQCASCRAAGERASWVELSVADSGTGIAAEVLERIFEPFVSTKEVGRGSGMGLAMVHGIVHDHGGHVLVETDPGTGTVFRVVLPPAGADVPADPPATEPASLVRGQPLRGRVLVVEDEVMVGDFMNELLTSWGLDVVLRRDPISALVWLENPANAVDLLITDQTMPQLTGVVLAQRATSVRAGLPVLLYSGNADDFDAAELTRSGVRGALRKPVDAQTLRALVTRWLGADRESSPP